MWSRIDPWEAYEKREKALIESRSGDTPLEEKGRTRLLTADDDEPDSEEEEDFYVKDWVEEESRNWEWGSERLKAEERYRFYNTRSTVMSLVPPSYRLKVGFPVFMKHDWKPQFGYPPCMYEYGRLSSRYTKGKLGATTIDGFLFNNLVGRIPLRTIKQSMSLDNWRRTLTARVENGHWEKIAKGKITIKENGEFDGLAAVFAITPGHLKECIQSELKHGLYPSKAALDGRKRFLPRDEMVIFENIPDDFIELLLRGTGIKTCPDSMMDLLENPEKYCIADYTPEEVWVRAVKGWRCLSPYLLGTNIVPSWTLGKNEWMYTSNPMLQSLPKIVRLFGLRGLNGERLVELDFSGCQLNIARAQAGREVMEDPYAEVQARLREMDVDIERKEVKRHTITGFNGRTLNNYRYRLLQGKEIYDPDHFSATLAVLSELGYPKDNGKPRRAQGRIMTEVMKYVIEATGYSGLPVHDAILVPSSFVGIAEAAMKKACMQLVGTELPYKRLSPAVSD